MLSAFHACRAFQTAAFAIHILEIRCKMDLPFSDLFDKLDVQPQELFFLQGVEMSHCVSAGDMDLFRQGTSCQVAFEGDLSYWLPLCPPMLDTARMCMAQSVNHSRTCSVSNEHYYY